MSEETSTESSSQIPSRESIVNDFESSIVNIRELESVLKSLSEDFETHLSRVNILQHLVVRVEELRDRRIAAIEESSSDEA